MALLPSGKPVRTRAHGPCRLIVNISSQFLHWNSRHKRRIDHSRNCLCLVKDRQDVGPRCCG